jgi:hypothetical protein
MLLINEKRMDSYCSHRKACDRLCHDEQQHYRLDSMEMILNFRFVMNTVLDHSLMNQDIENDIYIELDSVVKYICKKCKIIPTLHIICSFK